MHKEMKQKVIDVIILQIKNMRNNIRIIIQKGNQEKTIPTKR